PVTETLVMVPVAGAVQIPPSILVLILIAPQSHVFGVSVTAGGLLHPGGLPPGLPGPAPLQVSITCTVLPVLKQPLVLSTVALKPPKPVAVIDVPPPVNEGPDQVKLLLPPIPEVSVAVRTSLTVPQRRI